MSAIVKAFWIFSTFGAGATIPFTTPFTKKYVQKILDLDTRKAGGETSNIQESLPKEPINLQPKEVMERVSEMLESDKGEPSCFWLPEKRQMRLEFLMCVYKNKLESPILFHYDIRNALGLGKQVKRVEQIIFGSGSIRMRFNDGKTTSVSGISKLYLTTLFRKRNTTLTPEQQCQVIRDGRNHKLTCSGAEVGQVNLATLHKNNHKTI